MKVLNHDELKRRCYEAIMNLSKVLGKDIEVVLRELEGMVDPENKETMLQAAIHAEAEEAARRYGYRNVREMNAASADQIAERAVLAGDYGIEYKREYLEGKRQRALEKERQDQAAKKKLAEIKLKAMKEKEARQLSLAQQFKDKEEVASEAAQAIKNLTQKGKIKGLLQEDAAFANKLPKCPYQIPAVPLSPVGKFEPASENEDDGKFNEFMDNVLRQKREKQGGPSWLQD